MSTKKTRILCVDDHAEIPVLEKLELTTRLQIAAFVRNEPHA